MGVPLVRRMELAEHIATMFRTRLRDMPQNNLRQADIPEGGDAIPNPIGTAPGLCVPGGRRQGRLRGAGRAVRDAGDGDRARDPGPRCAARVEVSAIVSRSLKTWGTSESALAEMVAHRLDALDASGQPDDRVPRARHRRARRAHHREGRDRGDAARALVDAEEQELRAILGDLVFGVDDETMEHAVLDRRLRTAAGRSASRSR